MQHVPPSAADLASNLATVLRSQCLSPEQVWSVASIMGMNAVYYRFRHMISKQGYSERMVRLRINRMMNPVTSKLQFELCSLACATIAGCQACLQVHDANVIEEGLTEDQVHDTIRIAAVIQGVAIALP
jgi:alkyl hydroperoxide reductase subunit D